MASWYARVVPPLHGALRALAGRLPVSHANLSMDFKIKRGMRGASHQALLECCLAWGAGTRRDRTAFWRNDRCRGTLLRGGGGLGFLRQKNLVDRTLQFYTELYLQDGILAKLDRASMHGRKREARFSIWKWPTLPADCRTS